MTRISSLFVASALAILPISAFAQPAAAPVKTATPVAAPMSDKAVTGKAVTDKTATAKTPTAATADVTKPAKPEVKTPAAGTKPEVHGMNTSKTHHARTTEPAKS